MAPCGRVHGSGVGSGSGSGSSVGSGEASACLVPNRDGQVDRDRQREEGSPVLFPVAWCVLRSVLRVAACGLAGWLSPDPAKPALA